MHATCVIKMYSLQQWLVQVLTLDDKHVTEYWLSFQQLVISERMSINRLFTLTMDDSGER